MKKAARQGLGRLLFLLPAILIAGVVGSLFFLNIGGGGKLGASTALPAKAPARTGQPAPKASSTPRPASEKKVLVPGRSLRILSWNLRDCAATDGRTGERLAFHEPIAELLARLKPDLAAFEEIQQDDEKGGDIALLQVALAKAGWSMPYQTSIETGGQDDIALFSRYPILSSEPVLEPGPSDPWPRAGLHAVVSTGAAPIRQAGEGDPFERLDIFVFHLKAMSDMDSESARKAQAAALADLVRKSMAAGTLSSLAVVAGDLNTTNPGDRGATGSTLGYLELKDDQDPSNDFLDAIEGLRPQVPTFVDKRYSSILDHILLSPKAASRLLPGSPQVFKDIPSVGSIPLSDHRPVLVELELGQDK
jgi:endonuclease/exonuclease/phosphatase family metal-dependent hydrolase